MPSLTPARLLAGSATVGLLCAMAMAYSLARPVKARSSAPPRVVAIRKVVVAARPSAALAPSSQHLAPKSVMLLPGTVSSVRKAVTNQNSSRTAPEPEKVTAPPTLEAPRDVSTLPTISQPSLTQASTPGRASPGGLPAIGAPPAPPEEPFEGEVFEDKPGGSVLVLGLLLNDAGAVLDARILVPSRYILGDMTAFYASKDLKFIDLIPPIRPGELRWIQQRIEQNKDIPNTSNLP